MERVNDYISLHYARTYARIPVYLIGILLGWLLHNTKNLKIHINRVNIYIKYCNSIIVNNCNITHPVFVSCNLDNSYSGWTCHDVRSSLLHG